MDKLSVKYLLYTDDQVILEPSACELLEIVNKMIDSVKKRGMKVNVNKTKVIMFERGETTTGCDILVEGEKVEQVKDISGAWRGVMSAGLRAATPLSRINYEFRKAACAGADIH
ncbi:hypothetical protein EVAR_85330_1 [Eumeta japonica]|uniref:Reverse transcriptase domain-containing protein n=1 Tax=Eumeta variegata TaxID=151549 RepID=A0A4C1WRM1_EUMVA|nr:hypothetical protein EVAR_85330_1 [Eumeta japonica]